MRSSLFAGATLVALAAMCSCGGGSSGGGSTPTTPSPTPTPSTPNTVTVTIVSSTGNKAYQPNPVQVNPGDTLMFRNDDSTAHHVVMDDGSTDFGEIAPGASKSATFKGTGGNFHCTIHATMVGSVNGTSAPDPPACPNNYCG